jgi:mRNA-degrading endonuclease HigB of HigAB toxin-antitoxin module
VVYRSTRQRAGRRRRWCLAKSGPSIRGDGRALRAAFQATRLQSVVSYLDQMLVGIKEVDGLAHSPGRCLATRALHVADRVELGPVGKSCPFDPLEHLVEFLQRSQWKTPEDVKKSHPKASILRSGRVVFNIKANDYRLIAVVQYAAGMLRIGFSESHEEYDQVDAESV